VNICEACEQFEGRVKQWNYTHGATDPLPYIDEMIKLHKHLILEDRGRDGAGGSELLFHCLMCDKWWILYAWAAVGQLDVWPCLPKTIHHNRRDSFWQKKGFTIKERRQYERFTFLLPVRIEAITSSRKEVLDLETRDISASGTFITTLTSFPEGKQFILDFTIPNDNIKGFKDVKSLKGYKGSMVRSTPHGMAIHFDRDCQIESLKAL